MKIATVVGARPQFIKAAVLSREIARRDGLREILIHTGQHYDARMSDVFFEELQIPRPDYFLGVGSGSQAEQTGKALVEVERVLQQERPDAVIVYGDTNSTVAGALAAAKLNVPVAHVEAGLRSFDRTMPEEINRCVTDHVSHWHFCPTQSAVDNLRVEGITANVFQVGDVMYDALRFYTGREPSQTVNHLWSATGLITDRAARPDDAPLTTHHSPPDLRSYALCTLHRAGNTDDEDRFRRLWEGVNRLADEVPVILPLHPRTRNVVARLELPASGNLRIIEPVGYRDMLMLEKRAKLIVTDSGGVQKEAYMQGVPCLTLRDNTEWTETVQAGWNRLIGQDADLLLAEARRILSAATAPPHPELYGDGAAGPKILDRLAA